MLTPYITYLQINHTMNGATLYVQPSVEKQNRRDTVLDKFLYLRATTFADIITGVKHGCWSNKTESAD